MQPNIHIVHKKCIQSMPYHIEFTCICVFFLLGPNFRINLKTYLIFKMNCNATKHNHNHESCHTISIPHIQFKSLKKIRSLLIFNDLLNFSKFLKIFKSVLF